MALRIAAIKAKDLEFLRRVRNDPRINEFLFNNANISKQEQRDWYKRYLKDDSTLIFVAHDAVPVGYCQVTNIDNKNHSCELGFCIAPEFQGKRYGKALVMKTVKYTKSKLHMHRVYVEVLADNFRALRLYKECGFNFEGYLRHKVFKDGRYRDVVIMSQINQVRSKPA
jgi:diamine N-acetyltransferase